MKEIKELELLANQNRRRIIDMVYQAGVGHVGGALSIIDILTAIYELDVDFKKEKRSRVILSKGHAVPAQYAILASYGMIDEGEFKTFRQLNSRLQGHPYTKDIPEVDATTGLLGQGFSMAVGHAIVKKNNKENHRIYAIAGDGEMKEGEMWGAKMSGAHHPLNNLVFIIDYNKLSSGGPTNDVIYMEVGAMMVGKIVNHDLQSFQKGQEKGYFEFGGSTIVVLLKKDIIDVDEDIIRNSSHHDETRVLMGEKIGIKKRKAMLK